LYRDHNRIYVDNGDELYYFYSIWINLTEINAPTACYSACHY